MQDPTNATPLVSGREPWNTGHVQSSVKIPKYQYIALGFAAWREMW